MSTSGVAYEEEGEDAAEEKTSKRTTLQGLFYGVEGEHSRAVERWVFILLEALTISSYRGYDTFSHPECNLWNKPSLMSCLAWPKSYNFSWRPIEDST